MRMRFSIRTLLLVTTLVAAACYWWVIRPSQIAVRFVRAIKSNDFAAADDCFLDPAERNLKSLYDKSWRFNASADLLPWSFQDVLRGQRHVRFGFAYGDAGPMRARGGKATVTPRGIYVPDNGRTGGGISYGGF